MWCAAMLVVVAIVSGCSNASPSTPAASDGGAPPTTAGPAATTPVVTAPIVTPPPSEPPPDTTTWALAWSDEFDGPAGTPPDRATWLYDIGGGGWGNDERQFYTDDVANAALDGEGNLLLTVRRSDGSFACHYGPCEYTSARLSTKGRHEFKYGRIEARIKVPGGFGIWPAFWMLGGNIGEVGWPACGEIDVMEYVGRRPNEVLGTVHGPRYSGSSGISQTVDLGAPASNDFHTFGVVWWPGNVVWLLDGAVYHQVREADVAPRQWVFDHPFFILLNVAVGGNLGGLVDPNLPLPASMAVDYVRVYQGPAA
jgi:beta-glucanase (GH16 family)